MEVVGPLEPVGGKDAERAEGAEKGGIEDRVEKAAEEGTEMWACETADEWV